VRGERKGVHTRRLEGKLAKATLRPEEIRGSLVSAILEASSRVDGSLNHVRRREEREGEGRRRRREVRRGRKEDIFCSLRGEGTQTVRNY
jgi:hypothetical protein